jgi:hypothetical protein
MYHTLAHLKYPDHYIHIACDQDTSNIQCFKYNDKTCDHQLFNVDELDLLSQYMITPLPNWRWGFREDSEH